MRAIFLRGTAAALVLLLLIPGIASAHERRDVGKLQFVVGWIGEPSLVGEPNGIDLRISDRASGSPVEGAEKTIKATVAFGGGQPREFPIKARFGQKGAYTADIIPTRTGTYVFTFSGAIGDQQVNEKFESGPGRFDDVKPLTDLQFPQAAPPTSELQTQLQAAQASVQQAQMAGVAGVVLGLLGLVVGGVALARKPRAA